MQGTCGCIAAGPNSQAAYVSVSLGERGALCAGILVCGDQPLVVEVGAVGRERDHLTSWDMAVYVNVRSKGADHVVQSSDAIQMVEHVVTHPVNAAVEKRRCVPRGADCSATASPDSGDRSWRD